MLNIESLCRMRSIEVVRLSDARASNRGRYVSRVKDRKDSIVKRTPRLKVAWDATLAARALTLALPSIHSRPIPLRLDQRLLFLNELGTALTNAGLDNAWQDFIHAAVDAEVIAPEPRLTLHGLKHRDIPDTPGRKAEKKEASGHKSEAMVDLYDHSCIILRRLNSAMALFDGT